MKKCIILAAAAIGMVTCDLSWTAATTSSIYSSSNIKLDLVQRGNFEYFSTYDGGVDPVKGDKWHYEAYGIRTWCKATFTLNLELFSIYKASPAFTVTVFDITPYKQIIKWYRPENTLMETLFDANNQVTDFWDAQIAATYSIQLF